MTITTNDIKTTGIYKYINFVLHCKLSTGFPNCTVLKGRKEADFSETK